MGLLAFIRKIPRLTAMVGMSYVVLVVLITGAFVLWAKRDMQTALARLENETTRQLADVVNILSLRTLDDLEDNAQAAPLLPIPFDRSPSPFSVKDLPAFKEYYPLYTFYGEKDYTQQTQLLVGHAPVLLHNGSLSKPYLSVIAWFNFPVNQRYRGLGRREKFDHFWFVYHDHKQQLHALMISPEVLDNNPERIAELTGYRASEYGNSQRLILESTLKGSLFADPTTGGFIAAFRIRLESTRQEPRATIDTTQGIGLQYQQGAIDRQPVISTFTINNQQLIDTPHFTGEILASALSKLPSAIEAMRVIDDTNQHTLTLMSEPSTASPPTPDRISRLFWWGLHALAEERFSAVMPLGKHLFRPVLTQSVSLAYPATQTLTLEVVINPYQQFAPLIKSLRQLTSFYGLVILSLFLVATFTIWRIVYPITRLATSLEVFEHSDFPRFRDPALSSQDEIGVLARKLHKALFRLKKRESILAKTNQALKKAHQEAKERDERRKELIQIMGHDIRTPVAALLKLLEHSDRRTLNYVKKIHIASDTILSSVKTEDAFLKTKEIEKINAVEFLQDIANGYRALGECTVYFHCSLEIVRIDTDPEFLEAIIDDIYTNSKAYGDTITFTLTETEQLCTLIIGNNGPPIDEAVIDTMFEYGVTTREDVDNDANEHHGIGLWSVALRIGLLGYKIYAKNQADGAAFVIEVPAIDS